MACISIPYNGHEPNRTGWNGWPYIFLAVVLALICPKSGAQDTAAQTAAVVKITAEEDGQRKTGAGFVVKTEADAAYIVTARHVVAGDKHPEVRFFADRTRAFKAEAIALDEHMDVALIVVRGRGNIPRSLEPLPIAVEKSLRAGDEVMAIGFPGGAGDWASVKSSVVGRKGMLLTLSGATEAGSSGGPVIKGGSVVAMITERARVYSFAVPARILRELLETWGVSLDQPVSARGPIASASRLTTLAGHAGAIDALAFSPGGEWLASAGADGNVLLWSVGKDWRSRQLLDQGPPAFGLVFDAEGDILTSAHQGELFRWSVRTSKRVPSPPLKVGVIPSPDGRTLAEFDEKGLVVLRDGVSGERLGNPLSKHATQTVNLEFNRDGSLLASASLDGEINLWNVGKRELVATLREAGNDPAEAKWIHFSQDGKRIAWVMGGTITVWDVERNQAVASLAPPLETYPLVFSVDGSALITGDISGAVSFWDLETGEPLDLGVKDSGNPVTALVMSPDGSTLVSGHRDNKIIVWTLEYGTGSGIGGERMATPRQVQRLSTPARAALFSADGKQVAVEHVDGAISLRDSESLEPTGAPMGIKNESAYAKPFAFSPDGKLLAASGDAGQALLWDVEHRSLQGAPLPLAENSTVTCFAFSPNGRMLAVGQSDGWIKVWRLDDRNVVLAAPLGRGDAVAAFAPDGKSLVASTRDKFMVWQVDTEDFTLAESSDRGASDQVGISPDGDILATVQNWGGVGGSIQMRSRQSGKALGAINVEGDQFRPGIINMFAFSADGRILATAHTDGSVRMWDSVTRQPIGRPLVRHQDSSHGATSVAFSPDGKRLVSAGGSVVIWDLHLGDR